MRTAAFFTAAAAGLLLASQALAADVRVEDPWARPSLGMVPNGSAYLSLHNDGGEADRLLGAETPVAERAELHDHVMEGDVARMQAVEAVELPAGEAVTLEPGGLHVMLMGLEEPLRVGDSFPLTLLLEEAGRIEVTVEVRELTGGHSSH